MRPAVIYCRVSTARQADKGISLEAQQAACKAYCKARKLEVVEVFVELGVSGRKAANRPQLNKAIARTCEVKGVLVFYSLSRFARSVQDTIALSQQVDKCGGDLASVTDEINTSTAMGKFYLTVLAAIARLESDTISERVKAVNDYTVKKKGYRTQGEQAFGWKIMNGEKVEVPEEQAILKTVRKYHKMGRGTLYQTSQKLNEDGVPIPSMVRFGQPGSWTPSTVKRLLGRK